MKTTTAILLLFIVRAFMAAPVGRPDASAGEPASATAGNTLRVGVHVSAMGNLDPHFAAGSQERMLADLLFNGLLRYQPGNAPHIEPDLAERIPDFEMIDGRQVWTVNLRKGVWFHPSPHSAAYELTAEDVVFSLKKSSDPRRCTGAGGYQGMTVDAVDRYTVRIALDEPVSATLFLPKLTNYGGGFIVSKRVIETAGYDAFQRHPVGTGPFVFGSYSPGDRLTLTANERYFRGRPRLDGVVLRFVPDIHDREAGLTADELDVIIGSGEKGWAESMARNRDVVIDTFGVGEVATLHFDTRRAPLDDVRVRRAIAFALDRSAFVETVSPKFVGSVYSFVPAQFLPGGLGREEVERLGLAYDLDLPKARRLMAAAGYPDGFSVDLVTSEKRLYRTYYAELQRQLARIGITCRIAVDTHASMHRRIRQTPPAMVIYVAWRPNADAYLSRFFHSDAIVASGVRPDTNFSAYDKVDRLIEEARREIDPFRQIQLWSQAQVRILDDMVAYPIMYTKQCYVRRARVDYGHPLVATMALYPQFTERTRLLPIP